MDYKEIYEEWLSNPYFDEATKEELRSIKDDDKEIKERFYKDLEFGTAGLRGVIGAGINRMNIYVVRVLPLPMIPAGCLRNLLRKQL